MRQRPGLLATGAVVCLGSVLLSGCDVDVRDRDLTGETATACRAFVAALPDSVGDHDRRKVDGTFGAAYGDPATVLRCGVSEPAALQPDSPCVTVNGVDWFEQSAKGGLLTTTVGRVPAVEMFVPKASMPADAEYVDVAEAVKQTTRREQPCL